jgi:hypothetical protein
MGTAHLECRSGWPEFDIVRPARMSRKRGRLRPFDERPRRAGISAIIKRCIDTEE